MDVTLLTQADFILSKCGRPQPPRGLSVIYIPKGFFVQVQLPVGQSQIITKEITGETTFALRAISMVGASSPKLDLQVQLPDGRFLINSLQDFQQIAGFGSSRYVFTEELDCPPESKIKVVFDDTIQAAGAVQPCSMLFEGAYKYFIKSPQEGCSLQLAGTMPRYLGHPNQAILADPWQLGMGPQTPDGYEDEIYTYGSQQVTIALAGPFTATGQITIDQTSDFEVRRLLFFVTADPTVSAATFLARLRAGSGYALMDEYLDVARYVGGACLAHDWEVKRGDTVFIDLELVDTTGTGNANIQTFLEGVKRKKI